MEAAYSSETLVSTHKYTRYYSPVQSGMFRLINGSIGAAGHGNDYE
jgi:hypothetical protein